MEISKILNTGCMTNERVVRITFRDNETETVRKGLKKGFNHELETPDRG